MRTKEPEVPEVPMELRMSRQQYEELLSGHIFHLTGLSHRPHPVIREKITIPADKYRAERTIEPLQPSTCLGTGHWNVTKQDIDIMYREGIDPFVAAKRIIEVGV